MSAAPPDIRTLESLLGPSRCAPPASFLPREHSAHRDCSGRLGWLKTWGRSARAARSPGSAVFGLCDEEINRGVGQPGRYFHHPDLPGVLPHGFSAPPEVCLMAMDMVGERLEDGLKLLPTRPPWS